MGLTFVWKNEEFGSSKTVELCPGGNNIVVNSKNRKNQYVHLLIQHFFVKSVSAKVAVLLAEAGEKSGKHTRRTNATKQTMTKFAGFGRSSQEVRMIDLTSLLR
ncbi:hypothetical protein C5167_026235 [Papaver somniferum]|nr:hypothetical protein C5167_026235 [Papaver somniferum]